MGYPEEDPLEDPDDLGELGEGIQISSSPGHVIQEIKA